MDDDGSTIKPTVVRALGVARYRSLSLSLSPSMIPFRSSFPFFSPLDRAKLITRASSSRRGEQETRNEVKDEKRSND